MLGTKNLSETDRYFRQYLRLKGYHLASIPMDGSLSIAIYGPDVNRQMDVRNEIYDHINKNFTRFSEYVEYHVTPKMTEMQRMVAIISEVEKIKQNTVWGTFCSLRAASDLYKRTIIVEQPLHAPNQIEPDDVVGEVIYMSHHNRNHFNLLHKIQDGCCNEIVVQYPMIERMHLIDNNFRIYLRLKDYYLVEVEKHDSPYNAISMVLNEDGGEQHQQIRSEIQRYIKNHEAELRNQLREHVLSLDGGLNSDDSVDKAITNFISQITMDGKPGDEFIVEMASYCFDRVFYLEKPLEFPTYYPDHKNIDDSTIYLSHHYSTHFNLLTKLTPRSTATNHPIPTMSSNSDITIIKPTFKKKDMKKKNSKNEEPNKQDPKTQNSQNEDFKKQDSTNEVLNKQDSKNDELKKQETKNEVLRKQDPKNDDRNKNDPENEVLKKQETKNEVLRKQDSKNDDRNKNDPENEVLKKPDSKNDDLKKKDSDNDIPDITDYDHPDYDNCDYDHPDYDNSDYDHPNSDVPDKQAYKKNLTLKKSRNKSVSKKRIQKGKRFSTIVSEETLVDPASSIIPFVPNPSLNNEQEKEALYMLRNMYFGGRSKVTVVFLVPVVDLPHATFFDVIQDFKSRDQRIPFINVVVIYKHEDVNWMRRDDDLPQVYTLYSCKFTVPVAKEFHERTTWLSNMILVPLIFSMNRRTWNGIRIIALARHTPLSLPVTLMTKGWNHVREGVKRCVELMEQHFDNFICMGCHPNCVLKKEPCHWDSQKFLKLDYLEGTSNMFMDSFNLFTSNGDGAHSVMQEVLKLYWQNTNDNTETLYNHLDSTYVDESEDYYSCYMVLYLDGPEMDVFDVESYYDMLNSDSVQKLIYVGSTTNNIFREGHLQSDSGTLCQVFTPTGRLFLLRSCIFKYEHEARRDEAEVIELLAYYLKQKTDSKQKAEFLLLNKRSEQMKLLSTTKTTSQNIIDFCASGIPIFSPDPLQTRIFTEGTFEGNYHKIKELDIIRGSVAYIEFNDVLMKKNYHEIRRRQP